jgi:two-component system cell cycle response regulator DivK
MENNINELSGEMENTNSVISFLGNGIHLRGSQKRGMSNDRIVQHMSRVFVKEEAVAKILYIEDIQDNITLVEKIVKSRGHEFKYARSAEEGLALAFEFKPDLILLDLGLPDADGQTLSVWLKGDPSLHSTPIIVLTAWPEEVVRQTVQAYNLNGYLCKPFTLADLVKKIDSALGTRSS